MNCIKIEFCAEDRARIDTLNARLEHLIAATDARIAQAQLVLEMEYDTPEEAAAPAPASPAVEAAVKNDFPPADDAPPFEVAPAPVVKPAVTLAQIQKKATQIAASPDPAIKARIREIINGAGADRVTALPEAAWPAVWDALCKLESGAV